MKKWRIAAFLLFFLAATLTICVLGCQKSKKPVLKPGAEGVEQESYPVRIYTYKTTFTVKESPSKLVSYFLKDLDWTKKFSGTLSFKVTDAKAGSDLSQAGKSVGVNTKVMGINFPCRVVNIKYVPEKEVWLLVITGDAWLLVRMETKPVPAGAFVTLNALAYMSPNLSAVADNLQLAKVVASKLDLAVAMVQAEFDPGLDPKSLTEKGLRGEMSEKFFQAYQASILINTTPDKVIKRGLDPDNFRQILAASQIGGIAECFFAPENRKRWDVKLVEGKEPEVIYCPDTSIKMAGIKFDTATFARIKPNDMEHFLATHVTALGVIIQLDLFGKPEKGGTRIWMRLVVEPPSTANLTEAFIAISGVPQWIKNMLIDIKSRTEAVG